MAAPAFVRAGSPLLLLLNATRLRFTAAAVAASPARIAHEHRHSENKIKVYFLFTNFHV